MDSMLPCVWNRSQRTSKCGKNISDTLGCASCATSLFLPHFDVICDLLLNRRTATWNLFVNHIALGISNTYSVRLHMEDFFRTPNVVAVGCNLSDGVSRFLLGEFSLFQEKQSKHPWSFK